MAAELLGSCGLSVIFHILRHRELIAQPLLPRTGPIVHCRIHRCMASGKSRCTFRVPRARLRRVIGTHTDVDETLGYVGAAHRIVGKDKDERARGELLERAAFLAKR